MKRLIRTINIMTCVLWILLGVLNFGIRENLHMIDYVVVYVVFLVSTIRDVVMFW